MNRRTFTTTLLASGAALGTHAHAQTISPVEGSRAEAVTSPPAKIRGVNLGGWLVLEKWITPSLFAGTDAKDEYSFSSTPAARARLRHHRETFITAADFAWIAARKLDTVRIPVGYWTLEDTKPFHPAADILDRAFDLAAQNNLRVLIDLHGAPGSQNGWDHSGRVGEKGWHTSRENIRMTLDQVERFAARYAERPNLFGIELLNEPHWEVPLATLKSFYEEGYARVRRHAGEHVAVVIHDGFRSLAWSGFMSGANYRNVYLDTHLYQCFTEEDLKMDAYQHLAKASIKRKEELDATRRQLPTLVAEWSLALPRKLHDAQTPAASDATTRAYAGAQLLNYENTSGWFFWNYKTEDSPRWSMRESIARGWLPERFA